MSLTLVTQCFRKSCSSHVLSILLIRPHRYVAHGAAQAIEDAGVLQTVLNKSSTDVTLAIQVYEQVRKARGEEVRKALHLPNGPQQEERDDKIREAAKAKAPFQTFGLTERLKDGSGEQTS